MHVDLVRIKRNPHDANSILVSKTQTPRPYHTDRSTIKLHYSVIELSSFHKSWSHTWTRLIWKFTILLAGFLGLCCVEVKIFFLCCVPILCISYQNIFARHVIVHGCLHTHDETFLFKQTLCEQFSICASTGKTVYVVSAWHIQQIWYIYCSINW